MKKFEVLENQKDLAVKITASTKAGLAIAAVQGMLSAAEPKIDEEEATDVKREFSVVADNFAELLSALLGQALSFGRANREYFQDVSFSLITDKKAEGELVGRPIFGYGKEIKSVRSVAPVEKNAEGSWETVVVFES